MGQWNKRTTRLYLAATMVVAFALRVYGLRWGLPNAQHLHSYHPDEFDIAARAALMLAQGDLNPHFFNYGSLTIYLTYIAGFVGSLAGLVNDLGGWHLAARLVTVAFSTATVYVVFLIGRTFYSEVVGLVAAAFLAVMPGHAVHSHYATVDVPATFFIALCLLCAAKMLVSPSKLWRVLAGLSAGWAGACKYNAAVVLLSALAAIAMSNVQCPMSNEPLDEADEEYIPQPAIIGHRSLVIGHWLLVIVCAAVAFIAFCPYVALDFPKFRQDFLYELEHVRTGSGLIFANTSNGFYHHLAVNLPVALSPPLLALALLGFFFSLWKHERRDIALAAFVVPYYFLIGSVQVKFLRYTLPLAPTFALYAAQWIEGWRWTRPQQDGVQEPLRCATRWFVLGFALLYSVAHVAVFARLDPRDAAADWMKQNAPQGASVGLVNVPWFYTPPLTPSNGGAKTKPMFEAESEKGNYKFVITNWKTSTLEQERPQFFVLSEFEYADEQRLQLSAPLQFLRALDERYVLEKTFQNPPRLLNWRVGPTSPPHDWLYPFPEVKVYRLKS
jgi:hypothetical protein